MISDLDKIAKPSTELYNEIRELLDVIPLLHWMVSKERPYAKDLDRDNQGKIIVDITKPHILEDVDYFRKAAITFKKTGKYTNYYPSRSPSSPYKKFWDEEIRRCKEGLVRKSDGEWITGYHYFYLNYSPILKTEIVGIRNEDGTVRAERVAGFPDFWDGDYLFYHYVDQAEKAGKYGTVLKARGKGYSFKAASMLARNYFLFKDSRSFALASDTEYLTTDGVLNKTWDIFSFVINNVGFAKKLTLIDQLMHKKAGYKKQGNAGEYGFKSEIIGVTLKNDPDKARGKRGKLIVWEEAGCHIKGTKIIMADGFLKNVEDIIIGDKLLGPDSESRTVLETHKGCDDMYRVTPKNGIEQVVNSRHKIHVKHLKQYKGSNPNYKTITPIEYIDEIKKYPKRKSNYSLVRPGIVHFNKKEVSIPPYLLGLWLGDGDSDRTRIGNTDIEVINYLQKYAEEINVECQITDIKGTDCKRIYLKSSKLRQQLKELNVLNNKHIPDGYIYTDEQSRLELLAGLIDSDGSYSHRKKAMQITQHGNRKQIIDKITFIARSLGMKVSRDRRISRPRFYKGKLIRGGQIQYRVTILYGHSRIPCLIERKKSEDRKGFLKDSLSTRFDVSYYGVSDYYGFTLNKDHLFLTEDFTITHNSFPYILKSWRLAQRSLEEGSRVFGFMLAFGCVCKGTKVYKADGTSCNIENLNQSDGILGYTSEGISLEHIEGFKAPFKKKCVKLVTNTGRTIECSTDHPILWSTQHLHSSKRLRDGNSKTLDKRDLKKKVLFKPAGDIKVGEQLAVIDTVPITGTKEMWNPRLIGLLIGDGSYGKNKTPVLSNADADINKYVESNFDTVVEKSYTTKDGRLYKELRIRGITCELRNLGIYTQTKCNKTLPTNIDSFNIASIREMLGGFFDADGYVYVTTTGTVKIILTSACKNLMLETMVLLNRFGIHGIVSYVKPNLKNPKDKSGYYRLTISDVDSVITFNKNIKFKVTEKQRRLDLVFHSSSVSRRSSHLKRLRVERVLSVKDIGSQDVYNLQTAGSHTYIANGIVTHNTGGEEGVDFIGLESLFYSSKAYQVYHVNNCWDKNAENGVCAFFVPDYMDIADCYDKNGNSDVVKALVQIIERRLEVKYNSSDATDFAQVKAEGPITPQEAVMRTEGTIFPSADIKEYLTSIEPTREHFVGQHYVGKLNWSPSGHVEFKPNFTDIPIRDWPFKGKDRTGAIELFELAKCNSGEIKPPWGRYIGGCDPVDDDEGTSLFNVWIMDLFTDSIVAEYTGRMPKADSNYEIALKLAIYYNAEINYENKLKGMFSYFERMNALSYLADTPEVLKDMEYIKQKYATGNKSKGTPPTPAINSWGRRMQADWMMTKNIFDPNDKLNLHRIRSIGYLKECAQWNPDGNFDRVSGGIMLFILRASKIKYVELNKENAKNKDKMAYSSDPFFQDNPYTTSFDMYQ